MGLDERGVAIAAPLLPTSLSSTKKPGNHEKADPEDAPIDDGLDDSPANRECPGSRTERSDRKRHRPVKKHVYFSISELRHQFWCAQSSEFHRCQCLRIHPVLLLGEFANGHVFDHRQ
jgi:hypothetical protein